MEIYMVRAIGYSEYLTAAQIGTNGGTLYGNSNINIAGGTIKGNVYGAGKGYSGYGTTRAALAQMYGDSNITIEGNPTINGSVYGAGEGSGAAGYNAMARLTGVSTININNDIGLNVYGGGDAGEVVGNTYVNINSGNITGTIYGGGNVGLINGTTNINITGGSSDSIYGGGQSADVTTTNINLSRRNHK